jgi:hypothetical protein
MISHDILTHMVGHPLATVDVYLIAHVEFEPVLCGVVVKPSDSFKIGYSANPFSRLRDLRTASSKNLALFGIIMCPDRGAAERTENAIHEMLRNQRGRGEWFNGNAMDAWRVIGEKFPCLWLTPRYTIDLDRMQLVPFSRKSGYSESYHWYAELKETGRVPPLYYEPTPYSPIYHAMECFVVMPPQPLDH